MDTLVEKDILRAIEELRENDKAQDRKLDELLDDKKAVIAQVKLVKWFVFVAPLAWLAVQWLTQHVKL